MRLERIISVDEFASCLLAMRDAGDSSVNHWIDGPLPEIFFPIRVNDDACRLVGLLWLTDFINGSADAHFSCIKFPSHDRMNQIPSV